MDCDRITLLIGESKDGVMNAQLHYDETFGEKKNTAMYLDDKTLIDVQLLTDKYLSMEQVFEDLSRRFKHISDVLTVVENGQTRQKAIPRK